VKLNVTVLKYVFCQCVQSVKCYTFYQHLHFNGVWYGMRTVVDGNIEQALDEVAESRTPPGPGVVSDDVG